MQRFLPIKIVSGGQTGVDRGALDAAIELGVEHGGWCPKGRLAEDGSIPDRYHLSETDTARYAERTERNLLDSDATLILHRGPLSGGTLLTFQLAAKHYRPCLAIDLDEPPLFDTVLPWLSTHRPETLNVAGPRESGCAGIAEEANVYIKRLFGGE